MSRSLVRAAALAATAIWMAGCDTTDFWVDDDRPAAALTSTEAAKTDQNSTDSLDAAAKNLPTDLDGEIHRAQLLRADGDYDGATKSLAQLMLVAPDDPRVVGEYGKLLAQRGRTQDALAFLRRAIELQPGEWSFYSALGVTYDQLDNRPLAAAAYEQALALKPGDPTVLNNYAISRMLAGDYPGAQRLLAQAQANGADYAKIANNIQMVADMQAKQKPSSANLAAAAKPVATAAVAAPRAATKAPAPAAAVADTQTAAAGTQTAASKPAASMTVAAAAIANAAPGTVMMQQVPYDPYAGPVKTATQPPRKLASPQPTSAKLAAKPAVPKAAKQASADTDAPKLRAAADNP